VTGTRISPRVAQLTIGLAVVTTLLLVCIGFATTDWRTSPWAWLGVVVLTFVGSALSFLLWKGQKESEGRPSTGGNTIKTGDVTAGGTVEAVTPAGGSIETRKVDAGRNVRLAVGQGKKRRR